MYEVLPRSCAIAIASAFLALALTGPAGPAAGAAAIRADHVEVELVAEHTAVARNPTRNWVALRLRPDPGWHVYWINPGDSGVATTIIWSLPAGVIAGPIEWPAPHAQSYGELTNYGYGEEVLHLVPINVSAEWPAAAPVPLRAEARWLVCADVCIPGSAELALELPVSEAPAPDAAWAAAFTRAREALPHEEPTWRARFTTAGGVFTLVVEGAPRTADRVEFFPERNDLVDHAAPQRLAVDEGGGLRLEQRLSSYFVDAPAEVLGVLVLHQGASSRAYRVRAVPAAETAASAAPVAPPTAGLPRGRGFFWTLLSALLGGLILNLMPCVFPILSLKALAVMRSLDGDAVAARRQGLLYTLGVVLSFAAIAGLLLALRAFGQAIGWGFQLQSPPFVGFLAYLLFALGLSLSGVVHFGLRWAALGTLGADATERSSGTRDFLSGVLAVVVASPCTAPFMGTALGYALTASAPTAIAVFVALGLGMALPFLVLGFFPRLAGWLPRPGAWMETFKQVMAFPLYLTVVWLLWVLARQAGADAAALVLIGLVLVAFALWLWHRPSVPARALRLAALALAALLLASPTVTGAGAADGERASQGVSQRASQGAEVWSEQRVSDLRAQGRTVFVDFTADWCLTCKVNERVAFAAPSVQQAFRDHDVAFLVADWSRSDPAITRVLERFGHPGVPLYLVYPNGGEPKVLPQLLTPATVIESLAP